MHTYILTCIHTHAHAHTYIHTRKQAYSWLAQEIFTTDNTHTFWHVYIHICTHTYLCIYTYTHTHIHTYTHTNRHTVDWRPRRFSQQMRRECVSWLGCQWRVSPRDLAGMCICVLWVCDYVCFYRYWYTYMVWCQRVYWLGCQWREFPRDLAGMYICVLWVYVYVRVAWDASGESLRETWQVCVFVYCGYMCMCVFIGIDIHTWYGVSVCIDWDASGECLRET